MKINKIFAALCLISSLCAAGSGASAAPAAPRKVETTLSANDIQYNVNTGDARAAGSVVIKREGATLTGDEAEGNTNDEKMALRGNVSGDFPEYQATLKSESVTWTGDKTKRTDGVIEAFGNVRLTRGAEDYLNADYVRWIPGTKNYSAKGGVDGRLNGKILDADSAAREGSRFRAAGVRRYEDPDEKIKVAARKVAGSLATDPKTGQETLKEIVAQQDVRLDYVDNKGLTTRVTGEKAVYSNALGTIVVSGNAKAVRSDGKTVTADKMIVHEDSRLIEARGNSKIIFVIDEKDKKDADNGKNSREESSGERETPDGAEDGPEGEDGLSADEERWVEGE